VWLELDTSLGLSTDCALVQCTGAVIWP
jgi:hypothetical protein